MRGARPFGCRLSRNTFTGGCSSAGSAARKQRRHRGVVRDQRPVAVDRDRRIGLVALEHEIDRLARRLQRRIAERALREHRREAGRHQQHVALAQRHVEAFGQMQHHLARRLRAAGLQEAQMLGGNLRFEREIELAAGGGAGAIRASDRRWDGRSACPEHSARARRVSITCELIDWRDGRRLIGGTGTALSEEIARRANQTGVRHAPIDQIRSCAPCCSPTRWRAARPAC